MCNRSGQSLEKTRLKIMEMFGGPPPERHDGMTGKTIPPSEFGTYAGTYRNGETTTRITERGGKLFIDAQELQKGVDGWLVTKSADGETERQIFAVPGPDGKIEYLYAGGRAAIRINARGNP